MIETLHIPSDRDGALWVYRWRKQLPMHRHRELEMNLVLSGSATVLAAGMRYALTAGSLVWLFPGQDHVLLDPSENFCMWIGVFRPRMTARVCTDPSTRVLRRRNPAGEFCRRLPPQHLHRLSELIQQIADAPSIPLYNTGLAYVALSAWTAFDQCATIASPAAIHPTVHAAAHRLRDGDPSLSVEQLADELHISAHRLSHLFKQQTGVALVQFRNDCRLDRFLRLYQPRTDRQANALRIALACGFGSYAQFHRVFRKRFGVGPRTYFASPQTEKQPVRRTNQEVKLVRTARRFR